MLFYLSGEPARLLISEWHDAQNDAWMGRHVDAQLACQVKLAYQVGKVAGVLVPLLIPIQAVPAVQILIDEEVREHAQVVQGNPYVFATTTTQQKTHVNGTSAMRQVSQSQFKCYYSLFNHHFQRCSNLNTSIVN